MTKQLALGFLAALLLALSAASFAEGMPDQELSVDDFDWPEHTIALGALQVDGGAL